MAVVLPFQHEKRNCFGRSGVISNYSTQLGRTADELQTKILVIDDEEGIRDTLETILSLDGYDVTTAINGEEGIKSAEAHIPDLIICDIMMPVMDGYEVAKRVWKTKKWLPPRFYSYLLRHHTWISEKALVPEQTIT